MKHFDVIISVGTKDVFIVQKVMKYLLLNIEYKNLYLITDIRNNKFFRVKLLKKCRAFVINENELIPGLNILQIKKAVESHFITKGAPAGWYFQQFLKMGFALSRYVGEYYLIWDADTIPLNKISFFRNDKILINPKTEEHKAYFDTMNCLLGFGKQVNYSFISEHMMINTLVMKELLNSIKIHNKESVWTAIINSCNPNESNAFSEFETYGTYCLIKYPELNMQRNLRSFRNASLHYGRFVTVSTISFLKTNYDTASFELRGNPPFPYSLSLYLNKVFSKIIKFLR